MPAFSLSYYSFPDDLSLNKRQSLRTTLKATYRRIPQITYQSKSVGKMADFETLRVKCLIKPVHVDQFLRFV